MQLFLEFGYKLLEAGVQLVLSPFYWLAVVLIAIHYHRQMVTERRLFAVKMNSWIQQTGRAALGGLLAGIIVSVVAVSLGVVIPPSVVIILWIISILLLLVRVRWLCLAYSGGIVAILHSILLLVPNWQVEGWLGTWIQDLRELNAAGLLVLVAIIHAAEALLIRKQGAKFASPLFMESKRGRVVGAYQMQSLWPVPLILLLPMAAASEMLPWTPLLSGDVWQQGWVLAGLPVMLGFSELTYTYTPQEKADVTSNRLFIYAAVLLAVSLLSHWWGPLVPLAGLISICGHEGLVWYSRQEELRRSPIFTHGTRGLCVQAVLPGSPAEALGIHAGEIISKVNGIAIRTKEDMHQAMRANPAFCKLEIYNAEGAVKFAQSAIYAGEHHQLGVLLAPDDDVSYVAIVKQPSLFALLKASWRRSSHTQLDHETETSV